MKGGDPNGVFDLDAVHGIKLGCNAAQKHLIFDVSNFELVRFDDL